MVLRDSLHEQSLRLIPAPSRQPLCSKAVGLQPCWACCQGAQCTPKTAPLHKQSQLAGTRSLPHRLQDPSTAPDHVPAAAHTKAAKVRPQLTAEAIAAGRHQEESACRIISKIISKIRELHLITCQQPAITSAPILPRLLRSTAVQGTGLTIVSQRGCSQQQHAALCCCSSPAERLRTSALEDSCSRESLCLQTPYASQPSAQVQPDACGICMRLA